MENKMIETAGPELQQLARNRVEDMLFQIKEWHSSECRTSTAMHKHQATEVERRALDILDIVASNNRQEIKRVQQHIKERYAR